MSSADWTPISNGSGVYAIIMDATAPTPPDCLQVTAGGQYFENITGGSFKDSRISGWCNQAAANASTFLLALRSQDDTTFSAAPATYFETRINAQGSGDVGIVIRTIVNGAATTIVNTSLSSVIGDLVGVWSQFQFSALNSGTEILLRVSQWDGANFIPMLDAAVSIASYPTLDAVGFGRFGAEVSQSCKIDDVNFYSLT